MSSGVHVAGAWHPFTPFVKVAGAWHPAVGWVHVAGAWHRFTGAALGATGPGSVFGQCNSHAPDSSTPCSAVAVATIVATGGTGSYTYVWSRVSGVNFAVAGNTSATATFSENRSADNSSDTGVYRCVVSDGLSSVTVNVTVQLTFNNAL